MVFRTLINLLEIYWCIGLLFSFFYFPFCFCLETKKKNKSHFKFKNYACYDLVVCVPSLELRVVVILHNIVKGRKCTVKRVLISISVKFHTQEGLRANKPNKTAVADAYFHLVCFINFVNFYLPLHNQLCLRVLPSALEERVFYRKCDFLFFFNLLISFPLPPPSCSNFCRAGE